MQFKRISLHIAKQAIESQYRCINKHNNGFIHNLEIPFVNLYQKVTGQHLSPKNLEQLRKKEPNLTNFTTEKLYLTLDILKKFGISAEEACCNPHLFCMNAISMDNYGEIFKECGFTKIVPKHLIRYNTIVKSRTIAYLKKEGLLNNESNLEEVLLAKFQEWPEQQKSLKKFCDANTSILTIRTSVLERYLEWRLHINNEDFAKYCKNYLPLRHRPMSDIRQAIDIAENIIKFELKVIKRNGFIISSDPVNTNLILENVDSLGGIEIKEAIRLEPAILKNNYNSLLEIKELLKQYDIAEEAQRRCLRVFCMNPDSVRDRLNELVNMKEYKVLATNPRV
ncbi:transcription termination factor 5, mitochondrial-like [Zerene cesonia]|uniref:transcription termination factor 5, mitochondrial-like n=1 Tax=Zerene cesonia TaxID=33412 RepID=UPI0018E51BFA|nr:transcription termination factor 5, mitochondrial-like [Zerene cesonia]